MLPSFPLCRIISAEKEIAVVSELLPGKSQMNLTKGTGSRGPGPGKYEDRKKDHPAEGCRVIPKGEMLRRMSRA
jgi:hypothetical protein